MKRTWWLAVGFVGMVGMIAADSARAIPAFARREGFSCQVCHFRMPELNENGRAYLRQGLREPSEQTAAGNALGQPLAVKWDNYLSVMGEHNFVAQRGQKAQFNAGETDLWAAGPFNRHWAAAVNPSFDIDEGDSSVGDAWGHYATNFGRRYGTMRFGQTLPDAILFNQGGPSVALSAPLMLSTPADTGTSWTPATFMRGLELGVVDEGGWNVYLGAGQPHLDDPQSDDRHTDAYGSAEFRLPRSGVSATAYGYLGKAVLPPDNRNEDFHRVGLFAQIERPVWKGIGGYMWGQDDTADGRSLDTSGFFVMGEGLISDRWAAYARYDHLRQDLTAGGGQTMQGPAIGVTYWAQTHLRITTEAQLLDTTGQLNQRMLTVDVVWIY